MWGYGCATLTPRNHWANTVPAVPGNTTHPGTRWRKSVSPIANTPDACTPGEVHGNWIPAAVRSDRDRAPVDDGPSPGSSSVHCCHLRGAAVTEEQSPSGAPKIPARGRWWAFAVRARSHWRTEHSRGCKDITFGGNPTGGEYLVSSEIKEKESAYRMVQTTEQSIIDVFNGEVTEINM